MGWVANGTCGCPVDVKGSLSIQVRSGGCNHPTTLLLSVLCPRPHTHSRTHALTHTPKLESETRRSPAADAAAHCTNPPMSLKCILDM
ncbi:hypothetical protein CTAM01_06701 [Colletotrichum tamarilloi]|uniref:Uncharacterized protein n=1 Tax=Colletotrichum tamarilloi TaxID=1209934 RepID=A0ABQ9RAW0_9PEZI|nr:uncharacterized protein CTAM01_06701 [Colletotrichum tamarilloi]KAK1500102.1 hypothetical protein CTAM01_06701 [Colletotrichum tamarilloi]